MKSQTSSTISLKRSRHSDASFGASFQFSAKTLLIWTAVISVLLGTGAVVIREIGNIRLEIADNYALTEVQEMISLHIRRHNGDFPQCWEDLRAEFDVVDQAYSLGPNGLDELQSRIVINFELLSDRRRLKSLLMDSNTSTELWFIRTRVRRKTDQEEIADGPESIGSEAWVNKRLEAVIRRAHL